MAERIRPEDFLRKQIPRNMAVTLVKRAKYSYASEGAGVLQKDRLTELTVPTHRTDEKLDREPSSNRITRSGVARDCADHNPRDSAP